MRSAERMDAQRAEGDVFEITDGCGDEIEARGEWGVVRLVSRHGSMRSGSGGRVRRVS